MQAYLQESRAELVTVLLQVLSRVLCEEEQLSLMSLAREMALEAVLIAALLLTHLAVAEKHTSSLLP